MNQFFTEKQAQAWSTPETPELAGKGRNGCVTTGGIRIICLPTEQQILKLFPQENKNILKKVYIKIGFYVRIAAVPLNTSDICLLHINPNKAVVSWRSVQFACRWLQTSFLWSYMEEKEVQLFLCTILFTFTQLFIVNIVNLLQSVILHFYSICRP